MAWPLTYPYPSAHQAHEKHYPYLVDCSRVLLYYSVGYEFDVPQNPETGNVSGMRIWTGAAFNVFDTLTVYFTFRTLPWSHEFRRVLFNNYRCYVTEMETNNSVTVSSLVEKRTLSKFTLK